jgi:hypothetical protein
MKIDALENKSVYSNLLKAFRKLPSETSSIEES